MNQRQDNWYDWISIAEFAYNNQVHASTQASPFMLDAGQNPQLGFRPIHESQLKSLDNFTSRMAQATNKARAALVKAANDMAWFYDIHWRKACYDLIRLGLGPVPELRPAWSDPPGVSAQSRHATRCIT